jgi:hypothetical protein
MFSFLRAIGFTGFKEVLLLMTTLQMLHTPPRSNTWLVFCMKQPSGASIQKRYLKLLLIRVTSAARLTTQCMSSEAAQDAGAAAHLRASSKGIVCKGLRYHKNGL